MKGRDELGKVNIERVIVCWLEKFTWATKHTYSSYLHTEFPRIMQNAWDLSQATRSYLRCNGLLMKNCLLSSTDSAKPQRSFCWRVGGDLWFYWLIFTASHPKGLGNRINLHFCVIVSSDVYFFHRVLSNTNTFNSSSKQWLCQYYCTDAPYGRWQNV